MKLLFWKECLYTYMLIHGGSFDPIGSGGIPKWSNIVFCQKCVTLSNFSLKNICKCKYAAFGGYFFAGWVIFDLFWPLGSSKRLKNCSMCKISDNIEPFMKKILICLNFSCEIISLWKFAASGRGIVLER